MEYPSISVITPTFNSATDLTDCLESIRNQEYPKSKIEIIVADGGSKDNTIKIAKKFNAKIFQNPRMTGEAGKAVGLKHAKNELIAFIDSDNILPNDKWFQEMVKPFYNKNIIGSEPWAYTYRKSDGFITRYSALLGMNDPLCLFLGNYDRKNTITGKWTGLPIKQIDKGSWLLITLTGQIVPTIGANGTILRSVFLRNYLNSKYLFDIDIIAGMAQRKRVLFAKVKTGIIHNYCRSSVIKFIQKQTRRIRDFMYYRKQGLRSYNWQANNIGFIMFVLSCATLLPLIVQSIIGYSKKQDPAWFFHPFACWITLVIYTFGFINYYADLKPNNKIF